MLVILAIFAAAIPASGQDQGRYFPETGHTLDLAFADLFDDLGGLVYLGYPITDSFIDPESGFLIQFTQNAQFNLAPQTTAGPLQASLNPLGELLGPWEAPLPDDGIPIGRFPGCQYYRPSGHRVCYAFLEYFERNGGAERFGYPISEIRIENERMVQYFQGFRLDWYPDLPPDQRIQIAPLGSMMFETRSLPRNLLRPSLPQRAAEYRVVRMNAQAGVRSPVMGKEGEQEVFLIVRDQNLQPVAGAAVTMQAFFDAEYRTLLMSQTNSQGISRGTIEFVDLRPGSFVDLRFTVVYGLFRVETRDSFLVWR
jgi:hypothetical protein